MVFVLRVFPTMIPFEFFCLSFAQFFKLFGETVTIQISFLVHLGFNLSTFLYILMKKTKSICLGIYHKQKQNIWYSPYTCFWKAYHISG